MSSHMATTKYMLLGTLAANSCIMSLSNQTGSGVNIIVKRVAAKLGFAGTAAATKVDYGLCRATGTAAAGTGGNTDGTTIGKRNPGSAASKALMRWGPAAITGLTADGVGDFKTTFANNQNGTPYWDELISDNQRRNETDPVVIVPGTSLALFTRTTGVAGSGIAVDLEWDEVSA